MYLIECVNELSPIIKRKNTIHNYLIKITNALEEYDFSIIEKRYWLNCFLLSYEIKQYYEVKDIDEDEFYFYKNSILPFLD